MRALDIPHRDGRRPRGIASSFHPTPIAPVGPGLWANDRYGLRSAKDMVRPGEGPDATAAKGFRRDRIVLGAVPNGASVPAEPRSGLGTRL